MSAAILAPAPPDDGIVTTLEFVTPEQAAAWLKRNRNRKLRPAWVSALARNMQTATFTYDAAPIRFDWNGYVIDGQHRLSAVVVAGVGQWFSVVRGLPPEAQETMDLLRPRTYSDTLTLRNEANGRLLAAVLRGVLRYKAGIRSTGGGDGRSPTNAEMSSLLAADSGRVRGAAMVAGQAKRLLRRAAPPSVVGVAYYVCATVDPVGAEQFYVAQLLETLDLKDGDPARVLRQRLEKDGDRMPHDDIFRYLLLAWNSFRDGQRITKLQAPRGGWTSKNSPEVR